VTQADRCSPPLISPGVDQDADEPCVFALGAVRNRLRKGRSLQEGLLHEVQRIVSGGDEPSGQPIQLVDVGVEQHREAVCFLAIEGVPGARTHTNKNV